MVSHRYQLLPQQSQEVNFNYGTVTDFNISKILQYIVFSLLLSILFLYYGYQGFSHNAAWHSKIKNSENNSMTQSYGILFQNNSITTTTNSWTNTSVLLERYKETSTDSTLFPNVHTTKDNSVPILGNTTALSILRSTTLAQQPLTTVSIKTTPLLISSTPANYSTTTPQPLTTISNENLVDYYVHSSQCHMPRIDIFKSSLNKSFKPLSAAKCAKDEPFVRVSYNVTTHRYSLHMNTKAMQKTKLTIICCYEQIIRSGGNGAYADMKAKILPCTNFLQDFAVPTHIEAMLIKCSSKDTKKQKSRILQEDAFGFVQYKNITKNVTVNTGDNDQQLPIVPSLLLIGIDSLSRFNFRQNMPKTMDYINKHNWFELEGYNKVADNTFPNLMALLTGYNQSTAFARCKPTVIGGLNECPFIWKHFKSAEYRTAYAEDIASLSTFNYNKKGFRLPPTDHYSRPFMLAIEKHLKVVKKASLPYCVGRRQYGEYIYDYAQQFAECYRNESIFGLFWTNSFSHNRYDVSSSMDSRMRRYFEEFERIGVFNDTIVFFYSDHGMRFGSVIQKPEGFLEERLPMFFISLPQWFQMAHPDFVRSLQINRNRLTTPYDIHMTMIHLLQLTQHPQLKNLELKKYHAEGCKRCQSVFHEMPANRSCEDASIPLHWCTCIPYKTLRPKDKLIQKITKMIIEHINAYIARSKDKGISDCSTLKLKKVHTAELQIREPTFHGDSNTYRIKFETTPKAASFQATAMYNKHTEMLNVAVEDISRLNSYAKDSTCVNDSEIKKYCICKSSLVKTTNT